MLVWPNEVGKLRNISEKIGKEKGHTLIKEDDLFRFLKTRIEKLDGIVITGGEPTLHADLPEFIKKIKDMGFLVKLDTNGTNPEMLEKLIEKELLDYIAMDLKVPEDKYEKVTGVKVDFSKIKKSIKIIMKAGIPYEFRTTVVPKLIDKNDIERMGKLIKGARVWYLQMFKSNIDLLNNKLKDIKPYSEKEMKEMAKIGENFVKKCEWR